MFFVNDTQTKRHQKIRSFLEMEPAIAVLLGAADFEWTVRRAILALGESPNVAIREQTLRKCHGLKAYEKAWEREVQPKHSVKLSTLIPDWEYFSDKAFPLRHRIIHGDLGTVSTDYATKRVEAIIQASRSIVQFAMSRDCDLYRRLKVRRRKQST